MTDPNKADAIRTGAAHASRADIEEILRLRRTLPVATSEERQAERLRQAGQAAPSVPQIVKSLAVQAQDTTQPPPLVPAPAPTDDSTIAAWLGEELPKLIALTTAVFTKQAEGGLSEAWRDIEALTTEVSQAVATGLPMVRGTEAKGLVVAIVLFLFNRFAAPLVGPFPALMIRGVLPFVVQFVYDRFVVPALSKLKK